MMSKIKNILVVMTSVTLMIGTSSQLASAADWLFDLNKTHVGFVTPPGSVTQVTGSFGQFDGQIIGDAFDQQHLKINFVVQSKSVSTGLGMRDNMLKGSSFFDVEKYPTVTFKSTRVTQVDPAHVIVQGDLTMLGITKPVKVNVTLERPKFDSTTKVVSINATADTTITRSDWGMSSYSTFVGNDIAVHTTGVLISNNVTPEELAKVAKH
jgi:polyisoprenoid-binding protein YceI